jgi:thiamine biosynthesis lipoprotein
MDQKRKKQLLWQVPFLTLLVIGTILIIRQQQSMPYRHCSGPIFGTTFHITYQHDENLQSSILSRMKEVDSVLSMFNRESVISRINRNEEVTPNEMFLEVFKLAQKVSAETGGAFDITVAPLVNAWGFGFKNGEMPDDHAIDSIMAFVGYKKVSYDGKNIRKQDPRIMLDCSAIAKGYGVDVIARLLKEKGIKNYLVEIGGEVISSGISKKRLPWKIGVVKPSDNEAEEGTELQTVLNVTDKAMATSGNYRNFYYKGGKKYAHTIDPKTGRPVQHNILSATVLTDHCADADAYATSFMVMGLDGAKKVLQQHPELMAYLIYDNNGQLGVWYSPSLKDKISQ